MIVPIFETPPMILKNAPPPILLKASLSNGMIPLASSSVRHLLM
jgi:hypothetical protein